MKNILLTLLIFLVVSLLVYLYLELNGTNEQFGSSDWADQWRALYAPRYVMVVDNKMQPVF